VRGGRGRFFPSKATFFVTISFLYLSSTLPLLFRVACFPPPTAPCSARSRVSSFPPTATEPMKEAQAVDKVNRFVLFCSTSRRQTFACSHASSPALTAKEAGFCPFALTCDVDARQFIVLPRGNGRLSPRWWWRQATAERSSRSFPTTLLSLRSGCRILISFLRSLVLVGVSLAITIARRQERDIIF
jgi:hypothetical protein